MNEQDAHSPTAARKPRILEPDRSRPDPSPKTIDELVSSDHPVRIVWEFVETLDFAPLLSAIKSVEGIAGRSAISVAVLTGLWLYATVEGISSARELDKRASDCDPYKWLCGGVGVNYHTLSDFRTKHVEWLEQQVVSMIAAMRAEGLIDLAKVGQDGLRVRANAGSGSFKREEKLDAFLAEAQQQWDRLQAEFEEGTSVATQREQAARRRAARERKARIEHAKQEVRKIQATREARKKGDGEQARASITDPESRRMKMPDGGFRPAYNVQFATTLDTFVIVGADVTNSGSDGGQMDPMLEKIETQQNELPDEHYTDGGFSTKEDIELAGKRQVVVFTPVKEAERQQRDGKDPYAPRRGESPEVTEWRERMGTAEGKEKYKQRCKCELSNAQARNHGLTRFLVRGLEKVKAVVMWHVLAINLLRRAALRAQKATV